MATATTPARPPLPPFTRDSAIQKVRLAEDGWNSRDPARVALPETDDVGLERRARIGRRRGRRRGLPKAYYVAVGTDSWTIIGL